MARAKAGTGEGRGQRESRGHLDLLILAVLADRPAHGYAIISRLRDRSAGTFDLPEGSVYPALHRLEEQGLAASTWVAEEGRRRRRYALTAAGTKLLEAERADWKRFSAGVESILRWRA